MNDTVFQVRVPTALLQYGLSQSDIEHHIAEWLVIALFTERRISSGKAARLLNISRLEFLDMLHKRGIAYLDYNSQELAEEFDALDKLDVQPIE